MRITHQPCTMFAHKSEHLDFYGDANGNLAMLWECEKDFTRFHDWDDENRLRMVVDNNRAGFYGYDANGERVYKLTGTSSITPPNHIESFASVHLNDAVLYPNPYVVVTEKNYTKHYYAGGERLATVIGNGGWCTMSPDVISVTPTEHEYNLQMYWGDIYQRYYPFEYPHEPQPVLTTNVDIGNNALPELQYMCPVGHLNQLSISYSHDILLTAIRNFCEAHGAEEDIFYTHGDHLGSANWITDYKGMPVQYMHYLPYGQLLANQQVTGSTYDERFKFTGKERDAETGYDYFGARYYWSLFKHWTSVDPLVDDYLHTSPYAYCNWNPIKFVDPDGRELISSFNLNPHNQPYSYYERNLRLNDYSKRNYDNNSPIIHFFAHGAPNRVRLKDGTAINTPQKMFNYLNEQSQEFKASCSTGKPSVLVLHSCSTGSGENSFAQQLSADELFSNTLVIAPSSVLEVGSKETISNAGSWIAFYNGKQVGTINAHDTPWYKFWGEKKEAVQLNDLFKNMTPEQIFKFFNVDLDK